MLLEPQNVVVYRVGELPGSTTRLDIRSEGKAVAEAFRSNPNLPGIILCDGENVTAGLSQQEFLRHMSRPFGMEVYLPRPIGVLVEHARLETLAIDSETTIEEAVEKCLTRAPERLYDPVLVVNTSEQDAKLVDCQTLFLAISSTASLRATQMGRILQAVPIGLFLFDKDGRISPEYSEALRAIFEVNELTNYGVVDLLSTMVSPGVLTKFRDYLGVLFNARLIDRLIKSINPIADVVAEFETLEPSGGRKKHLSFSFERVRIGQEITFILAMVEDRTRRVLMDEEIRLREDSAEKRLKLVVHMMALDEKDLSKFLDDLDSLCNRGDRLADGVRLAEPDMQTLALDVYRAAHAIKGEAGILGLDAFRSEIHKFEEVFRHPLKNAAAFVLDSKAVETGSRRLRDLLEQAREGIAMLRKITRDRLSSSLSNHSGAKPSSTEPANDSPMVNLVRATEQLVADLCGKYRKQAKFVPHSGEIEIPTGHFAILRTVIHQLVRNSFVHGIEPPEERVTMGKNSMATIQFAARARDGMIEYVVQDDGRGVDTDRIAAKAGVKTEVDRAGLTELIFTPGLSTADGDGIDAGRGIGLDMVRDVIERAGGTIVVHDKPGAFCAFQFVIPRESK